MAGWRDAIWWNTGYAGNTGFFLSTTLIPFFIFIALFILMMLNLHAIIGRVINIQLSVSIIANRELFLIGQDTYNLFLIVLELCNSYSV